MRPISMKSMSLNQIFTPITHKSTNGYAIPTSCNNILVLRAITIKLTLQKRYYSVISKNQDSTMEFTSKIQTDSMID